MPAIGLAQEVGNPIAGLEVAVQVCAPCHDILPGQGRMQDPGPLPFDFLEPLPFEDIARTPGVTATALYAWMQSPHPTMPNIILEEEELNNIVAYILSLGEAP
jgi:mono/diheme cytochrome c family protein